MLRWFDIDRSDDNLRDFRRSFDLLLDLHRDPVVRGRRRSPWPRANLRDTGEELMIHVGLPGVRLEDIEITGSADALKLSGSRDTPVPEGYAAHRRERPAMRFARSFRLPVDVELEQAEASLKQGILTIRLPKAPELRPRSITVSAG